MYHRKQSGRNAPPAEASASVVAARDHLTTLVEAFKARVGEDEELEWVCSKSARELLDMLNEEFQQRDTARNDVVVDGGGEGQQWTKGAIVKRLAMVSRASAMGAPIPKMAKAGARTSKFHGVCF